MTTSADIADTSQKRRTGLLKHSNLAAGEGLWIVPCEAVHTFGMNFPIDVLYLSKLEAEVLLDAAPPYETPVTDEFCPFQKNNLCTAREPRPLACRIYFCDPAYQETGNRLTEQSLERLKSLCDSEGLDWQYAPLHQFLNHP